MMSKNQIARIAGLLYLLLIISGIINLLYIPSKLIDWESASTTFENIQNSSTLFRLGIVSGIVTFLSFLLLSLVLYKLLHEVNKSHAWLMVVFVLVSIPISFINMLENFSVLTLISQPDYLSHWSIDQLQAQVMLHLTKFDSGIQISNIFWGLWLFPFGYLVYKSGFLPKLLGIFLMIGCFGYLIDFFGYFFYSEYGSTLIPDIVAIPSILGEFGICLWLLIMGTHKIMWKKKEIEAF